MSSIVNGVSSIENELYPEELQALKHLKQICPTCVHYSDRFLARCILAKRLDLKEAKKLVEKNWKWRKQHGFEVIPDFDQVKSHPLWKVGYAIPGARTKEGHIVIYMFPSRLLPEESTIEEMEAFLAYFFLRGVDSERIDAFRNGSILVGDCGGFGWRNFDMKFHKSMINNLQDTFPMNYRHILLLNSPSILKSVLSLCRMFLKKKVNERIAVIESIEQLYSFVEPQMIPKEIGGDLDFDSQDFISHVKSWELSCMNQQQSS